MKNKIKVTTQQQTIANSYINLKCSQNYNSNEKIAGYLIKFVAAANKNCIDEKIFVECTKILKAIQVLNKAGITTTL